MSGYDEVHELIADGENKQSGQKFWTISRRGRIVTVTYGKVGSAGRTEETDRGPQASNYVQTKLAEKLRKGYVYLDNASADRFQKVDFKSAVESLDDLLNDI